jgi:hypothetical protein
MTAVLLLLLLAAGWAAAAAAVRCAVDAHTARRTHARSRPKKIDVRRSTDPPPPPVNLVYLRPAATSYLPKQIGGGGGSGFGQEALLGILF